MRGSVLCPGASARRSRLRPRSLVMSGNDLVYHVTGHVREAEVAAAVPVGELRVIDAHQLQDCGLPVVDVHALFDGLEAEIVGGAVDDAALDAAAGEPRREAERIVIAAGVEAAAAGADFRDRRAAELRTADDE